MEEQGAGERIERVEVPLELEPDDGGLFQLAQNVWVSFDDQHLYLRFYQVTPPIIRAGQVPESVPARLVARLIWPTEKLPELVRVLEEVGQKYELATGRKLAWESDEESAQ
jgi:hypothetical protein